LLNDAISTQARRAKSVTFLKFGAVGCTGVGVNTAALYALSRELGLPLAASSAVAVELAVISNYLLNEHWTFATRAVSVKRFAKFNLASLAGLGINVLTVWSVARLGIYFLLANLFGIVAGFASNYALSFIWVWGQALWREMSSTPCWC
jgi:putative flippase GtrA